MLCHVLVWLRGQSSVVWFEASTLYRYDVRKGDLFGLSCDKMRRCALISVASVVFIKLSLAFVPIYPHWLV